jgi:hypothetical protein
MASTDSHLIYTTLTQTQLRSFYNFLSQASILDSYIYLVIDKTRSVVSATSIKLNPSINAYADVFHTIDAISTYGEPRANFFTENWVGANSTIQNYWDSGGIVYSLFNARELMNVIKTYSIEDDTTIRFQLDCQLDPEAREYWAVSVQLTSQEIAAKYGEQALVRSTGFDKTIDNGYNKYHDMNYYKTVLTGTIYTLPTDSESKYKSTLSQADLRVLLAAYPQGEILFDVASHGGVYFNNYGISEKQPNVFSMGKSSDMFHQSDVQIDADVLDEETNYNASSPNLQVINGDDFPHTLFSPQFEIQRLTSLTASNSAWTAEPMAFTLYACNKAAYSPENGDGGYNNPAIKWLEVSTNGAGADLRMRIYGKQTPFQVITKRNNNDLGAYIDNAVEGIEFSDDDITRT